MNYKDRDSTEGDPQLSPSLQLSMIIHSWGTPRTLTTALMYSFNQRSDTIVYDEPLYAHYLRLHPEQSRPYREELMKNMENDGNKFLSSLLSVSSPVQYCKHIAKFYNELDKDLLFNSKCVHILLLRNPLGVIRSWGANKENGIVPTCDADDVGFVDLMRIYLDIKKHTGQAPVIVDTDLLKRYPTLILRELCLSLNLPFQEQMLNWPSGPKDCDGLWASHWYHSVHKTSGFLQQSPSVSSLSQTHSNVVSQQDGSSLSLQQLEVLRDCMPFYERLHRCALGRNPNNPGSSVINENRLYLPLTSVALRIRDNKTVIDHGIQMSASDLPDPRNGDIMIYVGDKLLPRELAKVSVFDSTVQGGDAVWEGMRIYKNKKGESIIFKMKEHLDRLFDSARAMGFGSMSGDGCTDLVPSRKYIVEALKETIAVNGMYDEAHMRVTLSRGPKTTSSMNPVFNAFGCCLIIVPEWKSVGGVATYDNVKGIDLITATNRRNPPSTVDSKIHHCNLINNILPKIQANLAGAADAVMLDLDGFIAETNATNIFIVKNGELITPDATACLPGITRNTIMLIANHLGVTVTERRISLAELHASDECFTTGSMGELTPVRSCDGRLIGMGARENDDKDVSAIQRPITTRMQKAYRYLTSTGEDIRDYVE